MKKIQILGTGCPKCKRLKENVGNAIKELGLEGDIEQVSNIMEIMKFGVMRTPALALDGKVVSAGKVLSVEEIKDFINLF